MPLCWLIISVKILYWVTNKFGYVVRLYWVTNKFGDDFTRARWHVRGKEMYNDHFYAPAALSP